MRVLLLSLVLVGCQPRPPGPDLAWRQFVEATRKGDAATAWPLLSEATQEKLTKAAQAVAKAEGKEPPKDGSDLMLRQRSTLVPPPKTVEAVFQGPNEATVHVVDQAGERGSVRAVKEDGRWRFDLTAVL